jgi:hypothetical protein
MILCEGRIAIQLLRNFPVSYGTWSFRYHDRLERILTVVCVVQNYLASFGLYPSSGMWEFYKRLALSNGPNWVGLPCPIHLRTETDPVFETLWPFVKLPHTRGWIESKRSQIILSLPCLKETATGSNSENAEPNPPSLVSLDDLPIYAQVL